MEGLTKCLCCLALLSLAMQGLGYVGTCKPSFQFIPGPPGRDGVPGSNGAPGPQGRDGRDCIPGSMSYSDYLKLKEELLTELKQELREQQPDCKCSPFPTPSSTYLPPIPSPSTADLFTSTLPSTANPSVAISPSVSPSTSPSPTPGTIGDSEDRPAQSCHQVYQTDSSSPSGYYWINTTEGPTEAYCVMNPPNCNITGGWMRVTLHNMTDPNTTCLGNTTEHTVDEKRFCAVSQDSHCDPVVFPVHGIPYNHVCGRTLGYSFCRPCAFVVYTRPLSQHYLTGLSITQGPLGDDDSHIWSYAAGFSGAEINNCNCPCAKHPGHSPSAYVGTDYYCDTATVTRGSRQWYTNNTLWDGKDCYPGTNCCANTRQPWFWRTLKQETNNDITVRWCADRVILDTNFGTELLEIYIH